MSKKSKKSKIWLIVATSLLLVGLILFTSVMSLLNWDFKSLSTSKYETNTHKISQNFENIEIDTITSNIEFIVDDNTECTVICYENTNEQNSVTIENNTLKIKTNSNKKWYDYIGINFESPKITVYIPSGKFGTLNIKNTTGDIVIPNNLKFKDIDISVTTGDIMASNVICKNFIVNGTTGNVTLSNVIATQKLNISINTGDVKLECCDSNEIYINTTTGDINGSLLTNKTFYCSATTGDISVPKTSGGKCEIGTTTGDIKITIK